MGDPHGGDTTGDLNTGARDSVHRRGCDGLKPYSGDQMDGGAHLSNERGCARALVQAVGAEVAGNGVNDGDRHQQRDNVVGNEARR